MVYSNISLRLSNKCCCSQFTHSSFRDSADCCISYNIIFHFKSTGETAVKRLAIFAAENSQECVNTCQMHHASKKYSVRRDTIRILRIWLRRKHFERNRAPASSLRPCLQVRTFVPTQLTTPGCCGIQRAIFATTQDTVKRIAEWQRLTGTATRYSGPSPAGGPVVPAPHI